MSISKEIHEPKNTGTETIEQEARRLVDGPRTQAYSHPYDDFNRTALIWTAIIGTPITAKQVALCMIGVKLSRETFMHKRDNLVDMIGYTLTEEKVIQKENEIALEASRKIKRNEEFNNEHNIPSRPL